MGWQLGSWGLLIVMLSSVFVIKYFGTYYGLYSDNGNGRNFEGMQHLTLSMGSVNTT